MTVYKFLTKITSVKEHFKYENWRQIQREDGSKETICQQISVGWFITLDGSRESLYISDTRPDLIEGQGVTVSITPSIPKEVVLK